MDMGLGERVRDRREKLGLTQVELGKLVGVGPNQIGGMESGRTTPSFKVFVSLGDVLGVSLDWLASRDTKYTVEIQAEKTYSRARLTRVLDSLPEADIEVLLATAEALQGKTNQDMVAESSP